jgi:hypothetical protein
MKFKTFLGTTTLALTLVSFTGFAHAQSVDTILNTTTNDTPVVTDTTSITTAPQTVSQSNQTTLDLNELAALKLREQSSDTGPIMKFILRFKIRQMENQLNIKKALK